MKKAVLIIIVIIATINLIIAQSANTDNYTEIGTIPGSLSVTPGGAAVYSMKIEVPPGIAGMTPELGLVYNSNGGDGVIGKGWGIGGMSVISKTAGTYYFNGFPKDVNFNNDQLVLDGKKLIKTDPNANEFRLETDDMTKIIKSWRRSKLNEGIKFVAHTKSGLKKTYGGTDESHLIYGSGANEALMYYISRIEDQFGNFIEYNYHQYDLDGSVYLKSINYGDDFRIIFEYEEMLPEHVKTVYFTYGAYSNDYYKYTSSKRLTKISIRKNSNEIRYYDLEYTQSGQLKEEVLSGVKLYSGTDSYNSTKFEWKSTLPSENKIVNNYTEVIPISAFKPLYFENGDFDNDGITDKAIYFDDNGETKVTVKLKGQTLVLNYSYRMKPVAAGDFNGDGSDELLYKNYYDEYRIIYFVYNPDTEKYESVTSSKLFTKEGDSGFAADINGDGITDFVHYDKEKDGIIKYYTGNIDNFLVESGINYYIGKDCSLYPGDYDGEGKYEIVVVKDITDFSMIELNYENTAFHKHGIAISDVDSKYSDRKNRKLLKEFFRSGRPNLLTGDFNKDGKTDIITYHNDQNGINYYFSYGYNFLKQNEEPISMPNDGIYASDVNGDGLTDIITLEYDDDDRAMDATYYYTNKNGLDLVEGATFRMVQDYDHESTTINQVSFGNYTGTGKTDMAFASFMQDSDPYYGICFDIRTCYYGGKYFNKITEITDGMDKTTLLHYQALPLTDNYTSTELELEKPMRKITPSFYVITKVENDNGMGGTMRPVEYEYKNAIAHRLGKGFLGFKEFNTINRIANRYLRNVYEIYTGTDGKSYYHPYKHISEEYSLETGEYGRQIISRTTNDITHIENPDDSKIFFYYVYNSFTEQYNFDLESPGVKMKEITITKEGFDKYGNPGKITMIKKDNKNTDLSTHKSVSEFKYWNNTEGDNWVLGRLYDIKVTKRYLNNNTIPVSVKHSVFTYYENENLKEFGKLKSETLEPENENSYIKTYTYNSDGNIETTIIDSYQNPSESTNRVTVNKYSDLNGGRFVTMTINPLEHVNYFQYNNTWGWKTKSTDPNGFSVDYQYNSFGRQIKASFPDGTSVHTEVSGVETGDEHKATNSVYYVRETKDGHAPVTTYFDKLGRKLRNVRNDVSGRFIYQDWYYNSKNGLVESVSKPYFLTAQRFYTVFCYDELNRPSMKILPGSRIYTTRYSEYSIFETNPENPTVEKRFDVNDNIVEIVENGIVTTKLHNADGKIIETTINDKENTKISCKYDIFGQLTEINDPAIGKKEYKYNCFGELLEVAHNGVIESNDIEYDKLGRILKHNEPGTGITAFSYDEAYIGLPDEAGFYDYQNGNVFLNKLIYDNLARNTEIKESIKHDGTIQEFTTHVSYDEYSRPEKLTYPSGFSITRKYNQYGFMHKIVRDSDSKVLWEGFNMTPKHQFTKMVYGNDIHVVRLYYPETGLPAIFASGEDFELVSVQHNFYHWDKVGNLTERTTHLYDGATSELTEAFSYDKLNRLISVNLKHMETIVDLEYDVLGRILYKRSDNEDFHVADNYYYDEYGPNPYKLEQIDNKPAFYNPVEQNLEYTLFDKISNITQFNTNANKANELNIHYGLGHQRKIQVIEDYDNNTTETKVYIGGIYEEITTNDVTKKVHYLSSPDGLFAIYSVDENNQKEFNYVHKDYLGSIEVLTNEDGEVVERLSYDAWGLRRDPETWIPYSGKQTTATDRGFTGHEHLDMFAMVNMNGRIYDPVIGYFSTPDPVIGIPGISHGFNLYSYVYNNPLRFTDPTGFMTSEILDIGAGPAYADMFKAIVELAESGAMDDATSYFAGVFAGVFDAAVANGASSEAAANTALAAATAAFAESPFSKSSENPMVGAQKTFGKMMETLNSYSKGKISGQPGVDMKQDAFKGYGDGSRMATAGMKVSSNGQISFDFSKTIVQNAMAGTESSMGGGKNANAANTSVALVTLGEVVIKGNSEKAGNLQLNSSASYIYDGQFKTAPLIHQLQAGQHVRVEVKNMNFLGVQLDLQDKSRYTYEKNWLGFERKVYTGDSYSMVLFPGQSRTFDFYCYGYVPMIWQFEVGTNMSDAANVRVRFYSDWIPGMLYDPNHPNR